MAKTLLLALSLVALAHLCLAAPPDIEDYITDLQNKTIVCARYLNSQDGFVRYASLAVAARVAKVQDGGALRLYPDDEVIGYDVDVLLWLREKARTQFNTTFNLVFVFYKVRVCCEVAIAAAPAGG